MQRPPVPRPFLVTVAPGCSYRADVKAAGVGCGRDGSRGMGLSTVCRSGADRRGAARTRLWVALGTTHSGLLRSPPRAARTKPVPCLCCGPAVPEGFASVR